jgi:hypothetical protein
MSFDYIRTADGTPAAATEACFSDGSTRPGYRAILRDGARLNANLLMMDSAAPAFLTDAERAFADSAEGAHAVARAKHTFDMGEAYKRPEDRQQWSGAMTANTIRAELQRKSSYARLIADMQAQTPALAAAAETARRLRDEALRNRHRGG